ncbi:25071_t:CDS:2 [Cetraspora pellucida]|uniref:25071_t:CDS:1 n=1 Tax=Cetraspora pellucida TaxID=1433469 RepID=A0A9N9NTV9_9GLOM|nr:25071_t:CDS:2 [Cetraspora pellucida]
MADASLSTGYYSIIVGGKTFKLSTTALYSDSPNYFTEIFSSPLEESRTKTMIIDRDPVIFADIVKHLQGYNITPRDENHYSDLYSDAIYYSLSKLKAQLRATYTINIGGKVFRVDREILETRDAPNFFTLGFVHGWDPPSNAPPIPLTIAPPIINRDPDLFSDILRYLQGYEIGIKDEVHRQNLLKDARFYHLKGLAEKLLASTVTVNGFGKHDCAKNEILFRLKDIRTSGVLLPECSNGDVMSEEGSVISTGATSHIMYKNKEGTVYILLVEVNNAHLICRYDSLSPWQTTPTILELALCDKEAKKLKDIAKAIKATEEIETIIRSPDICAFEVDEVKCTSKTLLNIDESSDLIKVDDQGGRHVDLFVTKGILRLFVNNERKIEMELLKCEVFSSEKGFNGKRDFLPADKRIAL